MIFIRDIFRILTFKFSNEVTFVFNNSKCKIFIQEKKSHKGFAQYSDGDWGIPEFEFSGSSIIHSRNEPKKYF